MENTQVFIDSDGTRRYILWLKPYINVMRRNINHTRMFPYTKLDSYLTKSDNINQIFFIRHHRLKFLEFFVAKNRELDGIIELCNCKTVRKSYFTSDENFLSRKLVLLIKNLDSEKT